MAALRQITEKLRALLERREPNFKRFSRFEAKRLGDRLGIDWSKIPLGEFQAGLTVELEHGSWERDTDVTHNDLVKTAKIAWVHLKQDPHYYTKLRRAGIADVPPVTK